MERLMFDTCFRTEFFFISFEIFLVVFSGIKNQQNTIFGDRIKPSTHLVPTKLNYVLSDFFRITKVLLNYYDFTHSNVVL